MPTIDPDDPCPCESGRPARACCIFNGAAEPREADTRPPAPLTGLSLPSCYASVLNDCSEDNTGEHFLSENVLRELAGKMVWIRGFPWQKTEPMRVGVGNLEANVLCGRHNSALSRLDEQAGRLFRTFRAVEHDLRNATGATKVRLFPGIDIERWLLKALMGLSSAGNARARGERVPWAPPLLWTRVLFGRVGFPPTWGLYVTGRVGDKLDLDPANLSIAPLITDGEVSGCSARIVGLELVLAMRNVAKRRTGALNDDSLHRPNELLFTRAPSTQWSVCFAWGRGLLVGGQVRIRWGPPPE